MFFLLDKITKVTSQFARKHKQLEGLNLSVDFLEEIAQKKEINTLETVETSNDNESRNNFFKGKGFAKANSLIGLNPFGAMTCSTVTCDECGPSFSSCNWQLEYALTLHLPNNFSSSNRERPLHLE